MYGADGLFYHTYSGSNSDIRRKNYKGIFTSIKLEKECGLSIDRNVLEFMSNSEYE